ncbi:hypothetical protein CNMCM6106_008986 [Aspergillus hiratsukae]|uniref:Uncharacterized protein n=1 Tax=Aspergillus hiratsukae TaxID=1194566 RepID=A0A8H6USS9_9EURO|nr:hypothetical protein CNMCM6106_008986 [Aspergillus hiratsukae]
MSPVFASAPAEAMGTMGHHIEMHPTAVEGSSPVSDQHVESALPSEQEQGSHFEDAFIDLDDMTSDNEPTHVPDNFDWFTFDETYGTFHEQRADVLSGRPNLIPTHNARGYGNVQRLTEAHTELFERSVETGNEGQLNAGIWGSLTGSPVPLSINSVLEEPHIRAHSNTPKVHIEQSTARDHEQRDELPSYGNSSAQHHDVSVESIDVGSSNVESQEDTDHASTTVDTSDAHHDVEMIESHTSESLDAGTPVAQAHVQDVEDPAKKTTPPLAKQSDGGKGKNGNQGQNGYVLVPINPSHHGGLLMTFLDSARPEPIHSDLSGEKDEASEGHSSSQKNSGDSTPPEANIEDLIDPALTAPSQNVGPNSELANISSDPAQHAENAYETPADSQEAQVANHSGGQGVTTSSTQGQSQQQSNGSAVLDHPTDNHAHQPTPVQQSQRRSLSSTAASNHVDQSQEHSARDVANEQQQIQPRPVNSERPAQGQAPQGQAPRSQHASPAPAVASNGGRSSQTPQALSKQASPDSAADGRKRPSIVDKLFPQLDQIPGPTSHDLMNPEWSRLELQTKFASLEEAEEAMNALNAPRAPPRDPDLEVSHDQKLAIVNSFLGAMTNMQGTDDKAKTRKIWRNIMIRTPVEVEVAAWNILELMIKYHRTTPLPKIPAPKKKKGEKKERKENEEDDMDEDEKAEKERTQDPTRSGALLSFPERAAAIARIFHASKATCKRMLDFKAQYVQKFVETPMSCVGRCRANLIGNEKKQEDIKRGRALKAQEEAKNEAEAGAEAEPPVDKRSAQEPNEVEDALMAGDDSLDIDKLLEEAVDTVLGQGTPGQAGAPSASAARGQSSYAHNGQYSQSYSMQGQNNAGQNRVMSNTGHNHGMNNNGQIRGVPNTGRNHVINNIGQIQGTAYPGHQAVSNTGQNHAMNDHRLVQGTAYSGQHGVSNTGQIPRTINPGQFPPTNSTGLQPSMNNMAGMYMDPASNAPRQPYGSNSGYDQLGISSDFSATAPPNSHSLNPHTPFDAYMWADSLGLEMPPPQNPAQHYAQHAALLPTYHQPTLTPTSMAGQNPVVSNMGANNGMPPNNQRRSRKRSSTDTGAAEGGRPTKKRR